jgi:hypothetical protein
MASQIKGGDDAQKNEDEPRKKREGKGKKKEERRKKKEERRKRKEKNEKRKDKDQPTKIYTTHSRRFLREFIYAHETEVATTINMSIWNSRERVGRITRIGDVGGVDSRRIVRLERDQSSTEDDRRRSRTAGTPRRM